MQMSLNNEVHGRNIVTKMLCVRYRDISSGYLNPTGLIIGQFRPHLNLQTVHLILDWIISDF